MTNQNQDEHVLPRPVEQLPEYAHGKARQALADKIVQSFQLSQAAADAIAAAVVDPAQVRKTIGEPTDPGVEEIAVPGGTMLGIRTTVWSRRVMPDPRNPRTLPQSRHPFAEDPGTGNEASKFRPLPDAQPPSADAPQAAELLVEVENREHLTWASMRARQYVLHANNWVESIETQGVMEAVWVVATTFAHADGPPDVTALITAEGSSRCTAVHDILQVMSADVPYDDETRIRKRIRELNESYIKEPNLKVKAALRCERMPALILVGFKPHAGGKTAFSTAVRSLVALRHVDHPEPWGEGPENEALANEILDELYRRQIISAKQKVYYAGSLTKAEAEAAHLPTDPVLRAAMIVRLFSRTDKDATNAIRIAFTSQATRKNITVRRRDDLATVLVLRAVAGEPAKVDQIRRYLREAFGGSVHRSDWDATGKATDQLVTDAAEEVKAWLAEGREVDGPGPASLELAVRAAYPLVVTGRLRADRGTANNDQPDRRKPGELLDTMRRSVQGVRQLGQAIRDFHAGTPIRAVDETGAIKTMADGSGPQLVHDVYLRNEFPPDGKVKNQLSRGTTPADQFNHALARFGSVLDELRDAHKALGAVLGDDGHALVDGLGVETRLANPWRVTLKQIEDDLSFWGRTFSRNVRVKAPSAFDLDAEDDEREPEADEDEDADLDLGNVVADRAAAE